MYYACIKDDLIDALDFLVSQGLDVEADPDYEAVFFDFLLNHCDTIIKYSPNLHRRTFFLDEDKCSVLSVVACICPLFIEHFISLVPKSIETIHDLTGRGENIFYSVYISDFYKCSPKEYSELFKFLISKGVDPNIRNNENHHSLSYLSFSVIKDESFTKELEDFAITLLIHGCELDFSWSMFNSIPEESKKYITEQVNKIKYIKNNLK